jgi:hypothetical protein
MWPCVCTLSLQCFKLGLGQNHGPWILPVPRVSSGEMFDESQRRHINKKGYKALLHIANQKQKAFTTPLTYVRES